MSYEILNSFGLIIFAAIASQYLAWRLKLPSIVLLTLVGLMLGPLTGLFDPHAIFGDLLHVVIEFSVVVLLFEGGLNLRLHELKEVSYGVKRLITLGVVINATITILVSRYLGHLSWEISFILGFILVVTGPTVIMPMLRQSRLSKKINSYLKWEGIINDPLGVLLVTLAYQYFTYQGFKPPGLEILFAVLKAFTFALIITLTLGYALKYLFEKTQYPDFLKVPTVLSTILLVFIISKQFQDGSGLLAVTTLGMFFANQDMLVLAELRKFKESISVFSVSLVFILLAANINISSLKSLNLDHVLFILSVVFLLRLVSIFLATVGSDMTIKERILVGWFGPRGIVAASMAGIFSLRLSELGLPEANYILPIVFSIVCLTVLVHSLTLIPLAESLKLTVESGKGLIIIGASGWMTELALLIHEAGIPVLLIDSSWKKLKKARQLGVQTHYGEAIIDAEEGKLDLSEYGYLLAATNEDAYNALACNVFAEDFDRINVYQLQLDSLDSLLGELPVSQGGKVIENSELTYENFERKHHQGWGFKKTPLSEEFSYEDYKNKLGANAVHLLTVGNSKNISFVTDQAKGQPGDTIVSFCKAD